LPSATIAGAETVVEPSPQLTVAVNSVAGAKAFLSWKVA
jgi:hypothetical protein